MEEENKQSERPDSISVSRTSKGAYSWDIKRYFDASIDDHELVIKHMKRIEEKLKEVFRNDKN